MDSRERDYGYPPIEGGLEDAVTPEADSASVLSLMFANAFADSSTSKVSGVHARLSKRGQAHQDFPDLTSAKLIQFVILNLKSGDTSDASTANATPGRTSLSYAHQLHLALTASRLVLTKDHQKDDQEIVRGPQRNVSMGGATLSWTVHIRRHHWHFTGTSPGFE
ncbi:hypothetical protein CORC01_11032 [Colletotrichum orchidophilum]|uniref:Uncharacterized protein n=1 Tax=Colletotrichum orchidophilum TaxID=1209926 RepID=A0A1G4AWU2_9PEZI|nr:uncharacterized protein CORC01_11032 [Colletotrichum orchidophilum]OHE93629.1 hypothetical protein CORC01_11032 [Colletotrichum orchidophilum]